MVADVAKWFAGQVVLVPVQVSATSHGPAEARQIVPALPAGCVHVTRVPLHTSAVHGFPSSVHAVPEGCRASAGQAALEPVQVSATSHSPADGRHTVVAGANPSAGHAAEPPVQVS